MLFYKAISSFFNAVENEICIDKDVLRRLNRETLTFTPIRPIKSLKYIDRYGISGGIYGAISVLFVIISPLYFLYKLFKVVFSKENEKRGGGLKNVVLVANSRIEHLMKRLDLKEEVSFLNINQSKKIGMSHVYQYLRWWDFIHVYFLSISAVLFLFWRLKNKRDIVQAYVAFDWFLVYLGLSKVKKNIDSVYFANHYDRWATMFDQLFSRKNVTLLQHGLLPETLQLSYQLNNLQSIYALNDESQRLFKKIFGCSEVNFFKLGSSLDLKSIQADKKTVLIIGQPHSMDLEVEIIKKLSKEFSVFVKPHPLYDASGYKKISSITLIEDKSLFPNVDVALCFESTLGVEYEASGVKVIWWKGMAVDSIYMAVKESIWT